MIETKQAVTVNAPIDAVWTHASDISRWAKIMPGYRECDLIDADTSRWVLKVGVGGMVRTVTVLVNVLEWAGPDRVAFIFELIGDPVQGGGTYLARSNADGQTELELHIQVSGSGPLAPMWEAMGGPLLPRFAKAFAKQLGEDIESALAAKL